MNQLLRFCKEFIHIIFRDLFEEAHTHDYQKYREKSYHKLVHHHVAVVAIEQN